MTNTDDIRLLQKIGVEMKRIILSGAQSNEQVSIPPTLEDGTAVYCLLRLIYGDAGEAETESAIGIDCALGFYLHTFNAAADSLNLSDADGEALFQRCGQ